MEVDGDMAPCLILHQLFYPSPPLKCPQYITAIIFQRITNYK